MLTSNKSTGSARGCKRTVLGITLGLLVSAFPWAAHSGVVETDLKGASSGLLDQSSEIKLKPKAHTSSGTGYQLRCWQYGKLIFEEDNLSLPPDTQVAYKLTLREREAGRSPVHLVETLNATCLVQPSHVSKQENGK
jgi:hypothetical protein